MNELCSATADLAAEERKVVSIGIAHERAIEELRPMFRPLVMRLEMYGFCEHKDQQRTGKDVREEMCAVDPAHLEGAIDEMMAGNETSWKKIRRGCCEKLVADMFGLKVMELL